MSTAESDVSWPLLRRIARDLCGTAAELAEVRPLSGGSVSTTLAVTLLDGAKFVLKLSPHRVDRSYPREAAQLAHLASLGIPTPKILRCHLATLDAPESYLILEFLDAVDLNKAKHACTPDDYDRLQHHLADLVLTLHQHTGKTYSRLCDEEEKENETPATSWPAFFESAYAPSWHELEKHPYTTPATRKKFARIHHALPRLLDHADAPRLTHDDLWSSNILCHKKEGTWQIAALIDPQAKYAHHECELAYLELFGTVTPAFLKHYKSKLRPSETYHAFRKQLYQLFFLMDHATYFGGHYHQKFAEAAAHLADKI